MKSDAATGGAAVAIFKSKDIAVTKVDAEKIGFMKVGEDGTIVRRYCTECGTILFNVRFFSFMFIHMSIVYCWSSLTLMFDIIKHIFFSGNE